MSALSDEALTGGAWVKGKNVWRWVPDPLPLIRVIEPRKPIPDLIACPYCRAKVTETCKSKSGHPVNHHSVRLAPRLCPCGELPAAKKVMCESCRAAARAETYRLRELRTPTRLRRKAVA